MKRRRLIRFAFAAALTGGFCAALVAMCAAALRASATPYALPFGIVVAAVGVLLVARDTA